MHLFISIGVGRLRFIKLEPRSITPTNTDSTNDLPYNCNIRISSPISWAVDAFAEGLGMTRRKRVLNKTTSKGLPPIKIKPLARMKRDSVSHSDDMIYTTDKEKPWVCKNCNRNYKWKNSLKCHIKNECGLPPKYFCTRMCGYKTNVHSNMKRHMNSKCKPRPESSDNDNDNDLSIE